MNDSNHNSIDNLYKQSARETSPLDLDNMILSQAKQSCQPKVIQTKSKRWLFSVATAAVFVMGFAVVFNLQNQNSDMQVSPSYNKLETTKKKRIKEHTETVSKEVTVTSYSAPPLEPHPTPKKAKRITSFVNKDNSTVESEGKEDQLAKSIELQHRDKVSKTKKEATLAKNNVLSSVKDAAPSLDKKLESEFEPVLADQNYSLEQERIMVIGSRLKSADTSMTHDIKELEELIASKKFKDANKLLTLLKVKYPNYDFSSIEKSIEI